MREQLLPYSSPQPPVHKHFSLMSPKIFQEQSNFKLEYLNFKRILPVEPEILRGESWEEGKGETGAGNGLVEREMGEGSRQ